MPEVTVDIDLDARMLSVLQERGFDNPKVMRRRIRRVFLSLLADDICDGKSTWPVETGYSQASFYCGGRGDEARLYNHASYAPEVERSTNAIASYIDNNLLDLTDRTLAFAGLPLRAKGIKGSFNRMLRRLNK